MSRISPVLLGVLVTWFAGPALALHILPDQIDDPHFTSGPCPVIQPSDGAACPAGAKSCPAFYDPKLLPAGYNSVSYCAALPTLTFGVTGYTLRTATLTIQERRSFLRAARRVESYVKDDVTVVVEPYKVAYLDPTGTNFATLVANEYWNPVCAADALMPPFTDQPPTIVKNGDGSYSYANLPETYTPVLEALKRKNANNDRPMALIDYLPSHEEINVEWPVSFVGWQDQTDLASQAVAHFLVGSAGNYPITPGAKPFTLCASPAAMKMLGFGPRFNRNGHNINDINAPGYNVNVTLPRTDGAIVVADLSDAVVSPGLFRAYGYIYDPSDPAVLATQLPKAYFANSLNLALPMGACADPAQCAYPQGVNPGLDLTGLFNHEINHVLGIMQSQYYKGGGLGTSLAYGYGTALFLLDLFDIDSDYVVPGYGHPGIHGLADFTAAPRNNNTFTPTTNLFGTTAAEVSPWVQFGAHDHLFVYGLKASSPQYVPLENYSEGNPDGDTAFQVGFVLPSATRAGYLFTDPSLVALAPLDIVHYEVEGYSIPSTIGVNTIRELSELATQGWNVDFSILQRERTRSPLAHWYRTCFDVNGVFTSAKNKNCRFSVQPRDIALLQ